MAGIRLLGLGGTDLVSGQLGNLFGAVTVGAAVDYAYVQVVNDTGVTQATLRVYLTLDAGGVAVSVAVADGGVARAGSYVYASPTPPGSGYTTASTWAAGVALPSLTNGQKCLVCIKRDPTTGTAAAPESNVLRISSD